MTGGQIGTTAPLCIYSMAIRTVLLEKGAPVFKRTTVDRLCLEQRSREKYECQKKHANVERCFRSVSDSPLRALLAATDKAEVEVEAFRDGREEWRTSLYEVSRFDKPFAECHIISRGAQAGNDNLSDHVDLPDPKPNGFFKVGL